MPPTIVTEQLRELLSQVVFLRDQRNRMFERGRGRASERRALNADISRAEGEFLAAAGQTASRDAGISEAAREYLNKAVAEYRAGQ